MANYLAITNTAVNFGSASTPFARGRNAVVHNNSGGSLILQSSDDGTTYATLATVADKGFAEIVIAPYMKVSTAATLHLIV